MEKWITDNGSKAKLGERIEVEIQHCNSKLNLPNERVKGMFKDDGFYFDDGDELSYNWNIIRWRKI